MMFSSLDEAWNQPNFPTIIKNKRPIIESFDESSKSTCDELIKKIMDCPSCIDQLKLTVVQNSPFSTVNKIYRKCLMYLTPQMKENIISILMVLAAIIFLMIILEK